MQQRNEMQEIGALLNASNSSNQIQIPNFDPTSPAPHDYFLEQMLSSLPSSWTDLKSDENGGQSNLENNVGFHYDEIDGGESQSAAVKMMMQQQLMIPANSHQNGVVNEFNSRNQGGDGSESVQALFNGFGSGNPAPPHQTQNFNHPQVNNFRSQGAEVVNQAPAATTVSNGCAAATGQPRQRVRARRGQATDPHSIAERLRRERIAERMKALQELVPNANKTDKASMLDEIVDYVKFLQLQVKVLSMSRLGGAAAVAPLVTDLSSEGGGVEDCIQTGANGAETGPSENNMTASERQVAKLMEDDMGSAMQYLQGKGLCLMPISLATTISAATCRNPIAASLNGNHHLFNGGDGPCSPSVSVLTAQSASMGISGVDGSTSISKP